ncbi:hypothetical protein [Halovivax cerinus]|uniref:Uncharacterized protein n=1 Tax=Halovivax cerinus TaxID=1487865 RepID=A0ABD5NLJ8_9EURY|nr:hypothetical protein [Halovivax cerinus]
MSIDVQRVIRTRPGFARLRRIVETTTRWDLLLAIIPMAFAGAATASTALGIPPEAGMTLASVVGSLALVDALFLRPPNGLQGA